MHGRRTDKVKLISYIEEKAIDFFTNCHNKIIDDNDFNNLFDENEKVGRETEVKNGQMGIVISSFHWTSTKEEIQKMIEEKKITKEEEAPVSLMSLVLVGDMLVLTSDKYLNAIEL